MRSRLVEIDNASDRQNHLPQKKYNHDMKIVMLIVLFWQLLVLDPEKRIPLDQIPLHPWIVKHCVKGERVANREKSYK